MKRDELKKEIIDELMDNCLSIWGDDGERRFYDDLETAQAEKMADTIINQLNLLCLGDRFKVISNRPRTTKGKEYTIFRIVEDENGFEYWFYNDRGNFSCIYHDEIEQLTKENK